MATRMLCAESGFCITTVSVTSSSSRSGASPVSARMLVTVAKKLWNCSWYPETLTATLMSASPAFFHATLCRHACRSTHSPITLINPDSSASGMKSLGIICPSCGWCQRKRASTELIAPLWILTFG